MNHLKPPIAYVIAGLCVALSSISVVRAQPAGRDDKSDKPSAAADTITGRVVLEGGRPAAGAMVTIQEISLIAPGVRSHADEDGSFSIAVVTGKLYRIGASYPGYLGTSSPTTSGGHRTGDRVTLSLAKGGVITGRVTTERGEPVVGLSVSAMTVRLGGRSMPESKSKSAFTDDRGIYRIFGLVPGGYRVVANLRDARDRNVITGFEKYLAVYHPSSPRADAEEVAVEAGREVTGIDIRYRRVLGHSISGVTLTKGESRCGGAIELSEKSGTAPVSTASSRPAGDVCMFSFDGVGEGEYTLLGYLHFGQGNVIASEPRSVSVTAADISGIRLELNPLGSVSGKVSFEGFTEATRPAGCKAPMEPRAERTFVRADNPAIIKGQIFRNSRFRSAGNYATVTGDFALRDLASGNFVMSVFPPALGWYVKSVLFPQSPRRTINVGRDGLTLGSGEAITDVSIVIAEGSGNIFGTLEGDAANAGTRWRLFLVPADAAAADDRLRYHVARIRGPKPVFDFQGVAPGQYWLVPRLRLPDDISDDHGNPLMWDAAERARLRKEGEAVGSPVDLKACQNVEGYSLVLPQR